MVLWLSFKICHKSSCRHNKSWELSLNMCVLYTASETDVFMVGIKWQLRMLHLYQDSLCVSFDTAVFACTYQCSVFTSCELNTDVFSKASIKWQLWWRVLHLYQDPSPLAQGTPSLCQYIHLVLLSGATSVLLSLVHCYY